MRRRGPAGVHRQNRGKFRCRILHLNFREPNLPGSLMSEGNGGGSGHLTPATPNYEISFEVKPSRLDHTPSGTPQSASSVALRRGRSKERALRRPNGRRLLRPQPPRRPHRAPSAGHERRADRRAELPVPRTPHSPKCAEGEFSEG